MKALCALLLVAALVLPPSTLAIEPRVLLLDEPFGALEITDRVVVMNQAGVEQAELSHERCCALDLRRGGSVVVVPRRIKVFVDRPEA